MTAPDQLLVADNLVRAYGRRGKASTTAVDGISATFTSHALHVITGPSGSGKSTLLHLLSGLDRPTRGTVHLDGRDINKLSPRAVSRLRSHTIGMVFQRFHLVPTLSARENITLPSELAGTRHDASWFEELVSLLGIEDRLSHVPAELSGGQQQRVAVARALLSKPKVLFADEPTGSLDREAGEALIKLLRTLTDNHGTTSIVVTHDERLAAEADHVLTVVDGKADTTATNPQQPERSAEEYSQLMNHGIDVLTNQVPAQPYPSSEPVDDGDLHDLARHETRAIVEAFWHETSGLVVTDVPAGERETEIALRPVTSADLAAESGWKPEHVQVYTSQDPFQQANPKLTAAADSLGERTVGLIHRLRLLDPEAADPALTYLSLSRSGRGRRPTIITEGLCETDPGIADWIRHLPDAEELAPVANPWSDCGSLRAAHVEAAAADGSTTRAVKIGPDLLPEVFFRANTRLLSALVGGGNDGLAVRERDAWERVILPQLIDMTAISDELRLTSIGTGTGEPAIDTGLAMARQTEQHTLKVVGYDINPASLAVAQVVAAGRAQEHRGRFEFEGRIANILTRDGLTEAVAGTRPHIVEAIGFTEYVPSDHAADPNEQRQRQLMARVGCLSAEEFIGTIYENLPLGSVFITGNMRDDSRQAPFVLHALGWKGIIQRSTKVYLRILERAGVPGEAVHLCLPCPDASSGVYNLVAIQKV